MTAISSSKLYKDVACPFCSLLCDDLSIRNKKDKLTVERHGCAKAIKNFQRSEPKVSPTIHGENVSIDEAVNHAASILRSAKQPLFAGSGTDVEGSRELMALAEISGAILDHVHGDGMMNNTLVLQNKGWIMTTLAEVKNRADLVIFIGTDASSHYPRFFERLIWNQPSLAGLKKNARDIVYIGDGLDTKPGVSPDGKKPSYIKCNNKEINETVSVIRALLNNANIQTDSIAPARLSALKRLCERILNANYGVIVWDAAEFPVNDGDIVIQTISEMIKDLNKSSRFAGLSLGGNNGGTTFMNVCTWQSGYPMRVNYSEGYPYYDPYSYSTKKILQENTADALMWLSSFDTSLVMPKTDMPSIVLSRPAKRPTHEAEVYFPIGVPGIDHQANLMRTDNVVSLPLKKLRDVKLESGSEILKKIRQAI